MGQVRDTWPCLGILNVHEHGGAYKIPFMGNPGMLLILLPDKTVTFLLGGAGIYHSGGWWLLPWLMTIIGFFGFVEIRVMCSDCPHYAEQGSSLKCWANYGSPKIWKYRPGPMAFWEKAFFYFFLLSFI